MRKYYNNLKSILNDYFRLRTDIKTIRSIYKTQCDKDSYYKTASQTNIRKSIHEVRRNSADLCRELKYKIKELDKKLTVLYSMIEFSNWG